MSKKKAKAAVKKVKRAIIQAFDEWDGRHMGASIPDAMAEVLAKAAIEEMEKIKTKEQNQDAARYCWLRNHNDYTIKNLAMTLQLRDVALFSAPIYAHLSSCRQPGDRRIIDDIVDFQIELQRRRAS